MPARNLVRHTTLVAASAAVLAAALAGGLHSASAQTGPVLLRDVRTGSDLLGSRTQPTTPTDYIQPDTQIEPSIAVNPNNPLNVVAGYQEGRVDGGGDATNGWATSFDGGRSWSFGELPGLTSYPGQSGPFDRGSDAVVTFGPNNDVYYSSLVFDDTSTDNSPTGNSTVEGMRSGMAINVSKDGGRTWSQPVFFADDNLQGLNDKNWVVVDNSDASGHHKGRVYVVWDRVAAVFYDYCDANCDQLSSWAFGGTFRQFDLPTPYVGQAIGATPVVLNDGSLAIIFNAAAGGVFTGTNAEQTFTPNPSTARLTAAIAPLAGTQPFGTPFVFLPPIYIADNDSGGVRAQRAGSLPSADYDTKTGTLAVAWEDSRFHTEATPVNDILVATSTDGGKTWSSPVKVNPGTSNDNVDRYNASISASGDGVLHVAYRSRQEATSLSGFAPNIQTYYQESSDGGQTWSAPLQVSTVTNNNAYYGAFSRGGTFEGDYNGIASAKGYSYIVRDEAYPAYAGEPPALTPDPSSPGSLALTGKGHQHQQTWVAVVGPATAAAASSGTQAASQTGSAAAPSAAAAGTPNTSATSGLSTRVTVAALALLAAVALVAGRRRRRT